MSDFNTKKLANYIAGGNVTHRKSRGAQKFSKIKLLSKDLICTSGSSLG